MKRTSTNFHPLFFPFIFYCEKNLYKFSPFILPLYFLLGKEPLQIFTLYSSPLFSTGKRTSTNFHPLFFPFIFYREKDLNKFSPFILPLHFLLWKGPLQIFTLYFLLLKGSLQIFTLYSSPLFSTVKRTSTKFHPLFSTVKRTSTNFHHLFFPLFSTVKRTSTKFHPLFFHFIFYCDKNLYKFSPCILPLYFLLWKEPLQIFTLYSSPLFSSVKRNSTNFQPLFFSFIFYCEKNLFRFSPFILLLYFLLLKEPLQIFTLYSSPLFSTAKRTSTNFHPIFFPFIFYC